MPVYCYQTNDGEVVELAMTIEEQQRRQRRDGSIVLEDGRTAIRDLTAEHGHRLHVKPYLAVSSALAVNPDRVAQTMSEDRYMGSMADEYRPDGKLVFRSRKRHDAYAKLRGFSNKDNYFGT